ncbi:hypothetical protein KVG29_04915 [Caldicoprobacter algeriensis]|uniref:hypothetical protein n=1 Tax=Caldicoprobacter algeriensis TaxID=699281 RepID=UPI0020797D11|nr:hypothetical protein [Caldicoprobacter algeriensis]MCM8900569.1 hypothetical protein [Caldicoprobacter algeriensis]
MSDKEIRDVVVVDILPANLDAEIRKAVQMRNALDKLFNELLQQGVDFDRVPRTDKPTLLKPGAELLCQVFRLAPGEPKIITSIEDFEKGIFSYTISIPILHRDTGMLVATGIGSANSWEVKYKYRKYEQDGEEVKVINPEPADQQNTLVKMAAKRAFVDGVLKATGASRMFTQDVEDMPWLKVEAEKASSKQLNYMKSFYRNINDEEALNNISEILGREVTSWDDITREEASKVIDYKQAEKKQASSQQPVQPEVSNEKVQTEYICAKCQKKITKAMATYSEKHFGQWLCQSCQKATTEDEAELPF